MSKPFEINPIERIIDANLNRLKEGLRVIEEIARFAVESPALSADLKSLRHKVETIAKRNFIRLDLLAQRNSPGDIGRLIKANELKRNTCADIFFANLQRIKESLRVLEEFSKLRNTRAALQFKKLRYQVYEIEKIFAKASSHLHKLR